MKRESRGAPSSIRLPRGTWGITAYWTFNDGSMTNSIRARRTLIEVKASHAETDN